MRAVNQARGSSKARGLPLRGVLDGWSTREAETKQARSLVERLAGGVVQCAPEVAKAAMPGHQDELRVAARQRMGKTGSTGRSGASHSQLA